MDTIDVIVQIYEIQRRDEAQEMIALGVDHIGSVLPDQQEWKSQGLKQTIALVQQAQRKSSLIPLFTDLDAIFRVIDYYRPDIIHFCETLPLAHASAPSVDPILDRQGAVKERFPEIDIMRSIPIGDEGNGDCFPSLDVARMFEPVSDWFLTDTLKSNGDRPIDTQQPVEGFVGITGRPCDWGVARALVRQSAIPVILAGGIGPHNAQMAIAQVRPVGIDSCTLTNATDALGQPIRFRKDPRKVAEMIRRAKEKGDQT